MPLTSARLSLVFSCLGHFYIHMFTAFFFVIVLTLEIEWNRPYDELFPLWTLGSVLLGLLAIPAGRLGDAWSVRGMMTLFFIGMGAASIVCGLMAEPIPLMLGLAGIGAFGAIYHPIGIPWLIRNTTRNTGKILAVNGVFGTLGNAGAGIVAGLLIDYLGWRAAFIVPGVLCLATGFAMLYYVAAGRIVDGGGADDEEATASRADVVRVFAIILVALFVGGMIYHSTQGALPKLFSVRLADFVGEGATGVGALVSLVYVVGAVMQMAGGFLADRYALKPIYIVSWFAQIFMLMAVALATGIGLVGAAILSVMANHGMLPAENMLLYRYAPKKHRGLVFGIKFVIAFGTGPLSVLVISWVWAEAGGFTWLFGGLSAAALALFALLWALPSEPGKARAVGAGD